MRFFTPDALHINEKNFKSLLSFIKDNKHTLIQNAAYKDLIARFGDYSDIENESIELIKKELCILGEEELFRADDFGINLFKVAKSEILSFVLADDEYTFKDTSDNHALFAHLHSKYFEVLLNNLSVARFWIRYWKKYFQVNRFDVALIFSGSLIYQRSAIELLKFNTARVYLLETYLTGNDFYIEERYKPISGDSLLKYENYYSNLFVEETPSNYMKAINKYLMTQNLNVKQPERTGTQLFNNNQKTILIIGQVVNDFSLIENDIYSIDIYIELIEKIMAKTNYNVIFKSHPWESHKANLKKAFTLDKVSKKIAANDRLKYTDNFNICELFDQVSHVILINSQAGIDAAWNGIRPIVLTRAFYSQKGFTFDAGCIDRAIEYIKNTEDSTLTIDEFKLFEQYLIRSFLGHLISKFPSGKVALSKIFNYEKQIPLYRREQKNNPKPIATPEIKPEAKPIKDRQKESKAIVIVRNQNEIQKKENKLLIKFKRDPISYFLDSKYLLLRGIGRVCRRCHEIFSH